MLPIIGKRNGRVTRHGLRRSRKRACRVGGIIKVFMRHMFAIKDLEQNGWFKPHSYRYFCVLCRWTFLVENRRGNAIALDESGSALNGAGGAARSDVCRRSLPRCNTRASIRRTEEHFPPHSRGEILHSATQEAGSPDATGLPWRSPRGTYQTLRRIAGEILQAGPGRARWSTERRVQTIATPC